MKNKFSILLGGRYSPAFRSHVKHTSFIYMLTITRIRPTNPGCKSVVFTGGGDDEILLITMLYSPWDIPS